MTTYYHIYTNIVREIVSRIETSKDNNGKLKELKKLYIGDIEAALENIETPAIFMVIDGIQESYEAQKKNSKSGDLNLNFIIQYPLSDNRSLQNKSIYYDDSSTQYLGFLPFLEAFFDVLHSDTSGSVDPRSNDLQRRSMQLSRSRIVKHKGFLETEVTLILRSKDFTMNQRYSD